MKHITIWNMLDGIETLIMLEQYGTVGEAAVRLRLTQSAVSKRIQGLQLAVGFTLVEPEGRKLRLTPRAIDFLERARPLVAELRGLTSPVQAGQVSTFTLAMADSIASSWGPAVVRLALSRLPDLRLDLHVHRSVLLIESVRLGRYHIGLCTDIPVVKDLVRYPLTSEPLVLVHSGFAHKPGKDLPLVTIEKGSATWAVVGPLLKRHHPRLLKRPLLLVESFSAALQMVKEGFGDGVVPLGLALEMGLDRRCYRELRDVQRGVCLFTRKTVQQTGAFATLQEQLAKATAEYFCQKSTPSR